MSLRPHEKTEVRRNRYKVAVDAEEGRRRREENLVEIRKNKREESLMKKRRDSMQDLQDLIPDSDSAENKDLSMIAGFWSDDPSSQLESTTQIRIILSIQMPSIENLIQYGVVPRLVEFLKKDDFPKLQLQAARALSNIATGTWEHTKVVIDHGAVPVLIYLLSSRDEALREKFIWALGNVAGDSTHCRDIVLKCGALMPLLSLLNEHSKLSLLRVSSWTLSNFCRGKPQPPFDQVKPALSAFERLVHSSDEQVLADTCWGLSYLSDGQEEEIQRVIEAGVVPRLVELLLHPSPFVLTPALRTIGNIVTGNTLQTQCVINNGALPILANLTTQFFTRCIKRDACWTISNITAGTEEQIQSVIDANLIPVLINLAQNAEFDIKKEAIWAISNAIAGGSHDQIRYLVEQSCIKPLCDILVCPDLEIISFCLDVLGKILKVGEAEKIRGHMNFIQLVEDAEGLEKIEKLQSNDNNEIYEKAVKILETYWVEEEDGFHLGFRFRRDQVQVFPEFYFC
ncbi:importin subunit alpha-1 isoform X2 [Eutrema salsugineum]|uniref:importin subunit alpha-1 isoform X2 n=1 Tax=Eutrema salsugineum TaxID=72664 RepID=UPI000CED6F28|nr:importin subunit alpha-1 isoform X2 [Eutrema salsugineum]